jgi:magnesium transporter
VPADRELAADPSLDDGDLEAARVRAFADTGTGCHPVSLEAAVAFVRDPDAGLEGCAERPPLVWIDVSRPGEAEAVFLRDSLGFHPLAVEDCIRGRQRPKLDRYPGYHFLVLYAARINADRGRVALNEIHVFLGRHYIVTVHDHRIGEFTEALSRWRASPASFRSVGAIAHAILDAVVDDYFPILDHFSERVDGAETGVFEGGDGHDMQAILALRRELTLFRRVVGPVRDLVGSILRRDQAMLEGDLQLYFQDVYDHALRIVEEIETLRDLLSSTLEGQLSVASNQLNVTMRVMAAWSIILMAMALVAGIYGMNFRFMPELSWRGGYEWSLALMGGIGLGLFAFFRRRGWV